MMVEKGRNSVISFIAMAMLVYFLGLPILAMLLKGMFGSIPEVLSAMIEVIPFGEGVFFLAVQIYGETLGQITNTIDVGWSLTVTYVLGELVKGLFVALIFEVINNVGVIVLGLKDAGGLWNIGKRVMITLVNAMLAACFAPLVIDFAFEQISLLGGIGAVLLRVLVGLIVSFGGVAIFVLLKGLSIVQGIVFVLVKFFLLDAVSLLLSYLCIMVALLSLEYGMPALFVTGVGGLVGVGLIVVGIGLALDSVFK